MNNQIFVRIGKKIRDMRNQRAVKLHELADAAQISKGLLSRIENGRTIPSLPVLLAVIRALDVNLDSFFEGLELPLQKAYIHRRKADYMPFEKEEAFGFLYHHILNGSIASIALEAVLLDLEPGSHREPVTTDGYEFKYILKGQVDYHLGQEVICLQEGDSLFFNGRIPHVPVNSGTETASMLVIYLLLPTNGNSS